MGGGSFTQRAERLTTPYLHALFRHCQNALSPHFEDIRMLRNLSDKDSHGDLDLVVHDGGQISPTNQPAVVAFPMSDLGPDAAVGRKMGPNDTGYESWEAWFRGIALAVGAVQWDRSGGTRVKIALAVPCDLISGAPNDAPGASAGTLTSDKADPAPSPFYQVDVCLLPPPEVDWSHFIKSHGVVRIVLSSTVRLISPTVVLHMTHVDLTYQPYPADGPICVYLSSSLPDLCQWLGLDLNRWERGFENEGELFEWLTDVADGGILRQGYEAIAVSEGEIKHVGAKHSPKIPGWKRFVDYVRRIQRYNPQGDQTTPKGPSSSESTTTVTPGLDDPLPLDSLASLALERFRRRDEFDSLLTHKTDELRLRAARQRRRGGEAGQALPPVEIAATAGVAVDEKRNGANDS